MMHVVDQPLRQSDLDFQSAWQHLGIEPHPHLHVRQGMIMTQMRAIMSAHYTPMRRTTDYVVSH